MARRLSLAESLASISEQDKEVQHQFIQSLDEQQQSFLGLRFNAKSTQQFEDLVLRTYRSFIAILCPAFADASIDEQESMAFPDDHPELFRRCRMYLVAVVDNAKPRSNRDKHITYATAARYRDVLIFWANRSFRLRIKSQPRSALLYQELTEALRGAAKEFSLTTATTSKVWIGLPELQYLMDMDMRATSCIEYTECHHLAWCIGRVTAVRPGSLGGQPKHLLEDPDNDESFLTWRDVKIIRTGEPGRFQAEILIRNLRTNHLDPANVGEHKSLLFTLLCPQKAENLMFSVPHRLLVIALRRGALADVDSLDQLMRGGLAQLRIKDQFLDQPVFVASAGRGRGVDVEQPLLSRELTNYLRRCGFRAGFPSIITFYSIRRQVASDLAQMYGNDAAREIMGHDARSKVLERYYLRFAYMKDLVGTALNEDPEGQRAELVAASNSSLIDRMTKEQMWRTQGLALNNLVDERLANDPVFGEMDDSKQIRNYKSRVRRGVLTNCGRRLLQRQESRCRWRN